MRKRTGKRILAVFLCISLIFVSYFGTVDMQEILALAAQNTETAESVGSHETKEEIKDRLVYKIQHEGWDPYSSDMSLEEFYALMEMFREGTLPIEAEERKAEAVDRYTSDVMTIAAPKKVRSVIGGARAAEEVCIPGSLFFMGGLGSYKGDDKPEPYDNENGNGDDYPGGLAAYGEKFFIPPSSWQGVQATQTNNTEAFVIVPGINESDRTVAGDVDQELFPKYDGYYVRRVTAQNVEVNILGAIKLFDDRYVYYYLTSDKQSTEVSTTMLAEGQKFVVQYNVSENVVNYELRMDDISSSAAIPDGITLDSVFGADRPTKTDDSKYAFTATAPYGYELELRALREGAENKTLLGWKSKGEYTDVNEGWALGKEPDYKGGTEAGGAVIPNTANGPSTLTMSSTIYNNDVHYDRTVVGILHKKDAPTFFFAVLYKDSAHLGGTGSRGSIAESWYDTDLDYAVNTSHDSALIAEADKSGHIKDYQNADGRAGKYPNVYTADGWGWRNSVYHGGEVKMTQEADGTYSHSMLFQTNSGENHVLDTLSINGYSVTIPFYPKYVVGDNTGYTAATGIGLSQWKTETTLPDGVFVRVEHLLVFGSAPTPQHHYRITVSGARNNVTISGMNIMTYTSGAAEFSAYYLKGVVADDAQTSGVQFFGKNGWETAVEPTIHVGEPSYPGDAEHYKANFRFKLADGYGNPYFLWESTQGGAIAGQGSGTRDELTGEVTEWNPQEAYPPAGEMDTTHIYGPDTDGYYYFRVTTSSDGPGKEHKIALLTVVARPVRYVVRYVPSYKDVGRESPDPEVSTIGIIDEPENMPEFEHDDVKCHPSFHWDTENKINGWEYDDKYGEYYDTAIDTVVILPTSIPEDPKNKYVFVDWVLVDDNFEPIKENDKELHYRGSNITLADINQYSIANEDLGGNETDVYVLRLMPVWKKIDNPFSYKVALNWVDAQGKLHADFFDDYWSAVVTDWQIDNDNGSGGLTVKVLKDADPFQNWIAQHPTYTFWDAVNNNNALYQYAKDNGGKVDDAGRDAMKEEMKNAIAEYLPFLVADGEIKDVDSYNEILKALCTRDISGIDENGDSVTDHSGNKKDDFWRLGEYAFQVLEDEGTIVVWMYENKGGLMFHEAVEYEPFINTEEFYYTVSNVQVGIDNDNTDPDAAPAEIDEDDIEANGLLTGTYKAYPEQAYDEFGKRRPINDKDAWLVQFKNGEIVSIVKNDGSAPPKENVTYFTLKDGEGIMLYVPKGKYTIVELGSKSGGSYKTEVDYNGNKDPTDEGWELPNSEQKELWLSGSEKTYHTDNIPDSVRQIPATVKFDIGENNVVSVLTFHNQTCSLAIGDEVLNSKYSGNDTFKYNVKLNLPASLTPLEEIPASLTPLEENKKHYYNYNIYNIGADGKWIPARTGKLELQPADEDDEDFNWVCNVNIGANQIITIVMTVPSINEEVFYHVEQGEVTILQGNKYKLSDGKEVKEGTVSAGDMAQEMYIYSPTIPTPGNLKITCAVEEEASDKVENAEDIEFTYTVTITNVTLENGTYGNMEFVDNVATFTLKAGEFITATGLPDGVRYTVVQEPSKKYELIKLGVAAKHIASNEAATKTGFVRDLPTASVSGIITAEYEDIITFTNKPVNDPGVSLPATGGSGTVMFYLIGGSMALTAIGYLAFTAKKRRKLVR